MPPVRTFGDYEIVSELGRGGMGIVYRARQKKLKRTVALKMLTGHFGKEELERFLAEAETVAQLHHPNIVYIHEVGEADGVPYFSMEYIEAGTLTERLRAKEMTAREAAELMLPVTRAIHFAHEQGIVHRDLKPGNILLDANGVPKVVDFGIAKRLNHDASLTLTGVVVGTPTYMAPEQAKGSSRLAGPAADVYSLGAILYELLTGRPPFLPEESDTALTLRVISEEPVSPAFHQPGIPRELEAICMMCLQKDPKERYASAEALADDLQRYLGDEPILAKPPTRLRRTVKWAKRHPWRMVGVLVLALVAGGALYRVWHWDRYERLHVVHAGGFTTVHGVVSPSEVLAPHELEQRGRSFRFTMQGRAGQVMLVEALNARGYPLAARRLYEQDAFPFFLEGLVSPPPDSMRSREATALRYSYRDGRVQEVQALDRNGQMVWQMQYQPGVGGDQALRVRLANSSGYEFRVVQGASHAEFLRDEKGRDARILFFDSTGRAAKNAEGVYGYTMEHDDAGRLTHLVNLDKGGKPMKNADYVTGVRLRWEPDGSRIMTFENADGKPVASGGAMSRLMELDAHGNFIRQTERDASGKPMNRVGLDFAVLQHERNARGEITATAALRAQPDGKLVEQWRRETTNDANGYPSKIKFISARGWQTLYQNDAVGNIVEEQFLDLDGKPVVGAGGWSLAKYKRGMNPASRNWREEEFYFDTQGGKAWPITGHHHIISEYDQTGRLVLKINDDYDPALGAGFRYISEPEFDGAGRITGMIGRFEDAQGNPLSGPGRFATNESKFDDQGRATQHWQMGNDVPTAGSAVIYTEVVWGTGSAKVREITQACDENRRPLEKTANGQPARVEKTYDDFGANMKSLVERGFDEKAVGFYEREVNIQPGSGSVSVTRRRRDGSMVPQAQVKVRIRRVLEGAPEPSRRLRVGDQVLTVNGREVTSMYMFGDGKGANGGAVEVLREGQRLKFEDFAPGPLGVLMEETAL